MNEPTEGDTSLILRAGLDRLRAALGDKWRQRRDEPLFVARVDRDRQWFLGLRVRTAPDGWVIEMTPAVVFHAVERMRVVLREEAGLGGLVDDRVPVTLHPRACHELGRLVLLVEKPAVFPPYDGPLGVARSWCEHFETITRVRAVLEAPELLRRWCGREPQARDYETLAAIHLGAGNPWMARGVLAAGERALGPRERRC